MAAHLSLLAKYHIADFVNFQEVILLPKEWHEMYDIYHSGGIERHRMPLPEYVMSKEFDLCLRKNVSQTTVEYLFIEGPEAIFWYNVPTGLISTIVESFLQRSTETALRPILCVCDYSTRGPTLLWEELYIDFFPCARCQRTQLGEERFPGREHPYRFHDPTLRERIRYQRTIHWFESMQKHAQLPTTYVIEMFHVKNPASGQKMTIELWFDSFRQDFLELMELFPSNGRIQKRKLCRVKIYAGGCANPAISLERAPPLRRRLLAELMLEAYRFLDRYSLDVSQLACIEWRVSVKRSSEQLALYPLSAAFKHVDCEREQERMGGHFRGVKLDHEWQATIVNHSDCFSEVNFRTFHFLNSQPPAHSSAVIHRHLRNAFVKMMSCSVMTRDFEWNVGMLHGLSDNTLVEKLNVLFMRDECLALLGRFEEGLIRRKVQKLDLTVLDRLLKTLIVHHNFFGRSAIRQLEVLELRIRFLNASFEPYWLPAIYEPSERRHLAIHYEPEHLAHDTVVLTHIHSALRLMLKDFETSGRDLAVDHFSLTSYAGMPSLVGSRKPAYEDIPVPLIFPFDCQHWDVYYYETTDKQKCLTLFLESDDARRITRGPTNIHVKRGKITDFS